ncbi:MAG: family 10 glycosylhydrolase, partial [Brachybacterium sp.]|nr:family 10 glycosylhydrolase [Brachybacterium sp.]
DRSPVRQMRAMWIATVFGIDWPNPEQSPAEQRAQYEALLDLAVEMNLNAVISQVRPAADAFWPSPYEPWSQYLTGRQGEDPGYDVLAFQIEAAHARNLEFHAWFNPYRASTQPDPDHLAADHPARVNPEWVWSYNGTLYYDPGRPDVRSFVQDAMMHAVENYDLDAVHFDDYFYPYPSEDEEIPDQDTYREYADGTESIEDWRRGNVDALVREMGERIRVAKPWVRFGISPFGIWRNDTTDPRGSATSGLESYDAQGADSRRWVQEGWVDYICPQLYWQIGNPAADYAVLLPWWADTVAGTDVSLYIGQAAYQAATWGDAQELTRQLTLGREHPEVDGHAWYSANHLESDPTGAIARATEDHYSSPALIEVFPGGADEPAPGTPTALRRVGPPRGDLDLRWNRRPGDRAGTVYYAIWSLPHPVESAEEVEEVGALLATHRATDAVVQEFGLDRALLGEAGLVAV